MKLRHALIGVICFSLSAIMLRGQVSALCSGGLFSCITGISTDGTKVTAVGVNTAAPAAGSLQTTNEVLAGTNVRIGSASFLYWTSRSSMSSPSDGVLTIWNAANTDLGRVQLGGTTSSYPAIARNAAGISFVLADNSANTGITASQVITTAGTVTGGASAPILYAGSLPQYVFMSGNVATAGATFTNLTGLTWTIPVGVAVNYPFHCVLTYNQATAATANAFQIQTSTNAPTNGTLYGLGSTAAGTFSRLNTKAYASTTATTIISLTPGATGTDERVELDGFIEQPSSGSTSAVQIGIATTSGGTDITTVARDGKCRLF